MKKTLLYTLLILLSAGFLYTQPKGPANEFNETLMTPFWEFYSQNNLSTINAGMGLTGIANSNDISGITLNPASLDLKNKFELKVEY